MARYLLGAQMSSSAQKSYLTPKNREKRQIDEKSQKIWAFYIGKIFLRKFNLSTLETSI